MTDPDMSAFNCSAAKNSTVNNSTANTSAPAEAAAQDSSRRFLVGIDLGTTHTAVAYADTSEGLAAAKPRLFEIDQLVGPGTIARKPLLPCCRYHPAKGELAAQDLQLPWSKTDLAGELDTVVIGEWARELSSKVEGRAVTSAKSWLSHPQVDRGADILPWAGAEDVAKVSPVLASASYLHHVRQAWNHHHPEAPLEHQEVVITVPASFDEVARSLTVEAAARAGLPRVLLLEEPQAVCYDWYAQNKPQAKARLADVKLLMVCDIGGGTTDLSLIKVAIEAGELTLTRIGVGDHLMLGGDNQDLALAHLAEQRIVNDGKRLSAASLSQLIQQTRNAKELLLSDNAPAAARVTVLGSGSKLIGGARSCELSQDEVRAIALDGFFPLVEAEARPDRRRSAVVEFGLPYAAEPAVSKHLADFIGRHQMACRQAQALEAQGSALAVPDALLLNGGVFNSTVLCQRAQQQLSQWRQQPIQLLENPHPDLAVAYGAVAYAMARHGAHLKIGGGSARSFFLLLDADKQTTDSPREGICLLPKGSEEGHEIRLTGRKFALKLGQPVSFLLASSSADEVFKAGELASLDADNCLQLPPLVTALEHAEGQQPELQVALATTLTEVGTLDLECVSLSDQQQRWRLEFEVRKSLAQAPVDGEISGSDAVLPARFEQARSLIDQVFGPSKQPFDPRAVKKLRPDLERLLGKREGWDSALLRALFDRLLDGLKRRRRSVAHERVWFNLAGFCLRPGFGHGLDPWRIQQVWPLYQQGLQFDSENQSWSDWWTFWRRAAGGLNQQQQQRLYASVSKYLNPAALRNRKLQTELKNKAYEDMVRLVASLEHLSVDNKSEIGNWLLKRLQKSTETPTSWWAIGRIGSRLPFHGSAHNVVPAATARQWLQKVLAEDWKKSPNAAFAAVLLARMSGDRARDLDPQSRQSVLDRLSAFKAPPLWIEMVSEVKQLDETETRRVFGEALPSGLKLID